MMKIAVTMEFSEKKSEQMKASSSTTTSWTTFDYLKGRKPVGKHQEDKKGKQNHRKPSGYSPSNGRPKYKSKTNIKCFRCGKPHLARECTLSREVRCHNCEKQGHLCTVCFKSSSTANQLEETMSLGHTDHRDKFFVSLLVDGKLIELLLRYINLTFTASLEIIWRRHWSLRWTVAQQSRSWVNWMSLIFSQERPYIVQIYNYYRIADVFCTVNIRAPTRPPRHNLYHNKNAALCNIFTRI